MVPHQEDDDMPSSPPQPQHATPAKLPMSKASRLPIPRKVSGIFSNSSFSKGGSLRPQPSRERLPSSNGDARIPPPRTNPTITKRPSVSRLPNGSDQGDRNFSDATASSIAKAHPRRMPSSGALNGTTPALKSKTSFTNLQAKPTVNTQLTRKTSGSLIGSPVLSPQLHTPRVSTTPKGRRTSDINGAAAPPLNRKPSNNQLKQPSTVHKRQSITQLSARNLQHLNAAPDASPTPLRRQPSSTGLPTMPRTPTASKPVRPPQTAPRQATRGPKPPPMASAPPAEQPSPQKGDHRKASQSLRDTIRQARAAKQRVASVSNGENNGIAATNGLDGFDFGTDDPFNQSILGEGGSTKVLQQRIKSARVEGRLNISNLELKEIPAAVYKMYDTSEEELAATDDDNGPKWYESVDLAKLIGADNEIGEVGEELAQQFGGLSFIDMHNNLLTGLPANLVQLTELTVLNLSGNQLDNGVLDIIFQIPTLKDLKLGKNNLEGEVDASISKLVALESLELQDNKLTSLPSSIGECCRLRSLNIARNALTALPLEELQHCHLLEIDISQNKLSGTFFPASVERWETLQSLNVKGNHITSFTESSVVLPALNQLFASNNQLTSFPTLTGWDELLVLLVDQNQITMLPEELYGIRRLRTLDFSGNSVKTIDPRLGAMDSLEVISFAGNPLFDRKLAGMSAADLKKTLRGRLAPPEIVIAEADDDEPCARPGTENGGSPAPTTVEVGRGGVLDLSNKNLDELTSELMDSIVGSPCTMVLAHNSFSVIPTNVDRFASLSSLDLSSNRLSAVYLPERLMLRSLDTLNLHNTGLASLELLFKNLDSPKLQTLDISANRVTSIEGLRQVFPALLHLHAANNQVEEIPLESIDGIRVLDLTGNSIGSLPPKLALCENLRELRVQGNLFRGAKSCSHHAQRNPY
ncbi:L domain-like protein [Wilcoxina mikolae CBS 423.85]|nr:L domain-like protein [Wilcoxina mikolae CBS 423.85]